MTTPEQSLLSDRFSQKEYEERKRQQRSLYVRNWLNSIFIVISALAMIGVVAFSYSEIGTMACYCLALIAVVVKMVEVMIRMSGFKRNSYDTRRNHTA